MALRHFSKMSPVPEHLKQKHDQRYTLEWKLLYSLIVAGKNAKFAENVMAKFMLQCPEGSTPFEYIRSMVDAGVLYSHLQECRSGNYGKLARAFMELGKINIDLSRCTPQLLETIKGIGPKTSRFFILWTRPGARYAALDTHILKWMKHKGYMNIPKSTPTGKRYAKIEGWFLNYCDQHNISPGDLDYKIWSYCQANLDKVRQGIWPRDLR
jgi:8-oxoguanine DNA glycosylase-like protein